MIIENHIENCIEICPTVWHKYTCAGYWTVWNWTELYCNELYIYFKWAIQSCCLFISLIGRAHFIFFLFFFSSPEQRIFSDLHFLCSSFIWNEHFICNKEKNLASFDKHISIVCFALLLFKTHNQIGRFSHLRHIIHISIVCVFHRKSSVSVALAIVFNRRKITSCKNIIIKMKLIRLPIFNLNVITEKEPNVSIEHCIVLCGVWYWCDFLFFLLLAVVRLVGFYLNGTSQLITNESN